MAKKRKENAKLFETVQIKNLQHAKRMVALAKANQIRILIGLVLAVIATGFTICGLKGMGKDPTMTCMTGFIIAVPAYLIGGGIFKALGFAWKIAKFGWFLVPVFPVDLMIGFLCLFYSVFCLMFVPIFFVGMNFIQHKKTLDAARDYLAQRGYEAAYAEE